ncbi:MAG: pyridoxamine 5'-phosphate oxidase [Actinomycetota bacterium]
MVDWGSFKAARPDLADAGAALLYQYGVGLAFLATVRADGGPRVHPMCPVIHDEGLFALIVPSPKRSDLLRNRLFSMHSFPAEKDEDAFYVSGEALAVDDQTVREGVVATYVRERPDLELSPVDLEPQMLFAFDIRRCLLTQTRGHGDPEPRHTVWHADASP